MMRRALCTLLGSTLVAGCTGVTGRSLLGPAADRFPLRWAFEPADDRVVFGVTVAADGRTLVVVGAHSQDVEAVCFDADGRERWRADVSPVLEHSTGVRLSVAGETAAVGGNDALHVFDAGTGARRWTGSEVSEVLATDDSVFAVTNDPYLNDPDELQVFDAVTGEAVREPESGSSVTRAPDGAALVGDPVGGSLRCYESDGTTRWTIGTESVARDRLRVAPGTVLLGSPTYADRPAVAYDLDDGEWLWSWPGTEATVDLFLAGSTPLVGLYDGVFWQTLAPRTPLRTNDVRWRRRDERLRGVGGAAFTTSYEGDLLAIDPASGEARWSRPLESASASLLSLARGRGVLVVGQSALTAVDPVGRERWSLDLGGPLVGGAVSPDRRFLVVTAAVDDEGADGEGAGHRALSLDV